MEEWNRSYNLTFTSFKSIISLRVKYFGKKLRKIHKHYFHFSSNLSSMCSFFFLKGNLLKFLSKSNQIKLKLLVLFGKYKNVRVHKRVQIMTNKHLKDFRSIFLNINLTLCNLCLWEVALSLFSLSNCINKLHKNFT